MGPRRASIGRGCKANGGSSTIEEAARLDGGNRRGSKGKRVRLHLCLVIARAVGVRVATDLDQGFRRESLKPDRQDESHAGKERADANAPAIARYKRHSAFPVHCSSLSNSVHYYQIDCLS